MLAKCTCNNSFRKYCCVELLVFNMLYSPEPVVPSTERSKQLKEKTKVAVNQFNAADLCKKRAAKDKGVVPVQPNWAPKIPKSKSMVQASAASLKRPASLKNKNETDLVDDAELLIQVASVAAEGDVECAVLDPDLPAKEAMGPDCAAKDASESSLKRKAVDPVPRLPRILRKKM